MFILLMNNEHVLDVIMSSNWNILKTNNLELILSCKLLLLIFIQIIFQNLGSDWCTIICAHNS